MFVSGTKKPENRIHLYDPVGLIHDNYGGYRPSNYTVRPRRQTVSYDNVVETINDNNGLRLRSYNSITDTNSTGGLRSFDSFEVDSFTFRSFDESMSSETTNGGSVSYRDDDSQTTMAEDPNDGGLRFAIGQTVVDDDQSDASTPRFWRPSSVTIPNSLHSHMNYNTTPKSMVNSPPLHSNNNPNSVNFLPSHPTSPKSSNVHTSALNPLMNSSHHNYQTMSPNSRTQAIAKGRRELMDMVRDLPETFYELSLKDIVEKKAAEMEAKEIDSPEAKKPIKEVTTKNHKETKKHKKSKKVKKSESKKKMMRSKSVDNGKFLLKTSVFPIFGLRKSRKNVSATGSFKVAPMPKAEQKLNGSVKIRDKEWWRRKTCISSESDSSSGLSSQSMSSRSNSSSSRRSNSSNGSRHSFRFLPNCCLFNGKRIRRKK